MTYLATLESIVIPMIAPVARTCAHITHGRLAASSSHLSDLPTRWRVFGTRKHRLQPGLHRHGHMRWRSLTKKSGH